VVSPAGDSLRNNRMSLAGDSFRNNRMLPAGNSFRKNWYRLPAKFYCVCSVLAGAVGRRVWRGSTYIIIILWVTL
jgi:hypothetical protein